MNELQVCLRALAEAYQQLDMARARIAELIAAQERADETA